MKKYETYKESGLEWLGCVPEHWETIKIKYLFSFGRGLNITKADLVEEGSPVISYGQIHSKSNTGVSITDELLRFVPMEIASAHPENKVHKGDFIFADTSEDKEGCGNCVYIDREGIYAGYHSLVLDGKGRNNKYLAYLFKSEPWRIQIRSKASGVKVFSITQSIMGESTVILPPLTEQLTIASYLDYKVSQIDVLIAEKEKMVADLKAYRSSVITEAVTKGLDKNVEMKESGVEWIKEIPSTWNILPLKRCAAIMTGGTPSTEKSKYWEVPTFPWYTPGDFSDEDIVLQESSRKLDMHAVEDHAAKVFPENSVLVVGIGATVGKIGIATTECSANQQVNAVTFDKSVLPLFGAYFLCAAKEYVRAQCNSATLPILNQTTTGELKIVLPPLDEQKQITELIQQKVSVIKSSVSEIEHELSDLKSYKSSLITEAVTGKIDLRGWEQQK